MHNRDWCTRFKGNIQEKNLNDTEESRNTWNQKEKKEISEERLPVECLPTD